MYEVAISWQHYELGQNMSISTICDQNQAVHEGFWVFPHPKTKNYFFPFFSASCSPNLQTNALSL